MWLSETPWPLVALCLAVGVLMAIGWSVRRHVGFLVGTAVAAVSCVGVIVAEHYIVTESERLEARLYDVVYAFQQKNLPVVLDAISERAGDIRVLAYRAMHSVNLGDDLRVSDVDVELLGENSRAITTFRVSVSVIIPGHGGLGRQPSRWELRWQREGGVWKIVQVRRLHLTREEEIGFFEGN